MRLRLQTAKPEICDLRRFFGVSLSRTRETDETPNLPHFCKRGAVVRILVCLLLSLRDFFLQGRLFYPFLHHTLIKKSIYKVYI